MKKTASLVLVLLLAGCPAKGGPQRVAVGAAPSPLTLPAGTPLPGFDGVRVNEVYVYDLPFHSSRTDRIAARKDDELLVERKVTLNRVPQEARMLHEPLVSSGRPFEPGGIALDDAFRKVGEERVTISGRDFDCDVFEAVGGGSVARFWVATRYPFVIRSKANDTLTLDLKQVLDEPPPEVPEGKPVTLGKDAPPLERK